MMSEDREGGLLPFMIVGTAGTTGAGVVDSLEELHDVATRHGAWFHVDAAWGGAAALSPKLGFPWTAHSPNVTLGGRLKFLYRTEPKTEIWMTSCGIPRGTHWC